MEFYKNSRLVHYCCLQDNFLSMKGYSQKFKNFEGSRDFMTSFNEFPSTADNVILWKKHLIYVQNTVGDAIVTISSFDVSLKLNQEQ